MKKEERKNIKLRVPPRLIILLIFVPITAYSQNASIEMETLLQTNAVTYAEAARFVLEASDAFVTQNPNEAFEYAHERNWLPKNTLSGEEARLDKIALLFMRSFGIKGGMIYTITKNPRYAYREMVYKNLIQGRADPAMKVSGEELLFITGKVLSITN